jgi:DNA-binding MarR family transcriptional regulator
MLSGQSLVTLLALVGAKRMSVETLRRRINLTPQAFGSLLGWLQREYLVDIVSGLDGDQVEVKVELTERGESVLVSMLESTCELPELH